MKSDKFARLLLVAGVCLAGLTGCQKEEGPAEKAGKKLDAAVEKAAAEVDKAAEKAGEQLEKAGERLKEAAKDDDK